MTIAIVQSKSGAGSSLSFTTPTTSGNCVAVVVCDSSAGVVVSTTAVTLGGSAGNFAKAGDAGGSSASNCMASFWVDRNCAGSQSAVAATITNQNDPVLHIYELSGVDPTAPLDLSVFAATTSSSSFTSGSSGVPNFANEILIGGVCVRLSLGSVGSVSGFVNLSQNGSGTTKTESGYVIETTAAAQTYTSTISTSAPHAAGIISLKAGSASAVPTTQPVPFGLAAPYPMNMINGSYAYPVQHPANIPSIIFAGPGTSAVTVTAQTGSEQVNYPSSPQFPIHQLQSFPPHLRLPVFTPRTPTSAKAGVIFQGVIATVTVTANTGSEAVNYPAIQQFPLAKNTPWPLPVVAPNLRPQRSDQSRTYVAGIKASVTVTAQTGSATPGIAGVTSEVSVSAYAGTEFTRISYAVPFPFSNYPYPLNLISGVRPQNPASKPGVFVSGVTATVTVQANFGVATALYSVTPQFPFTNLALPLSLRRFRQQNYTASPQHSYSGMRSFVTVTANTGSVSESPHGNTSAVTVHANTPVTRVTISEPASNVSVVSFAKTTISIRGNTSLDAVTARFGAISESVTAHGSVTVTPRTGSPKISVTGNSSSVNVSGVAGRTNISPHGNVSAVSSSSVVSLKVSVPEVPSPVLVSAVTGSPRIFVTDQVSKVTVKAYTEGVAFAGTVSHVSASAAFGGLSVKTTGMVSLVSSASHLGSAGGQFIEGHLDRLRWGAELIRPVEWE